jgi:uncharacterized protein involved in exopolysaccharide biosynthesis
MNQLGGLSGLAGISMGGDNKDNLILVKFKSREFLKKILAIPGIKEKLIASKAYDSSSQNIIYDEKIYDVEKSLWVRETPKNRKLIPTYIEIYESKIFQENLKISYNKKNSFITITFTHHSPVFAHDFITILINEMDLMSRKKELKESEDAILYLSKMLSEINNQEIKDLIGKLIESKLKSQMLANVNENFLINVIDEPFIPEIKSEPRRSVIVILSTFVGLIFSSLFVLTLSSNKRKR